MVESGDLMMDGVTPPDGVADGVRRQLDARWIPLERVHGLVFVGVLAFVSFMGIAALTVANGLLVMVFLLPLWAVAMLALAWHMVRWPAIAYRFTSYVVDDAGLEIARGVYWRTVTTVPRSRIQHTDVSQGPLERTHGLGTLVVYTAGTQHSEVKLPGLAFATAQRIRAHLLPHDQGDAV
jgi:membrane protein YdbS with pleckstrin-like domain